jgi:predicted helicase
MPRAEIMENFINSENIGLSTTRGIEIQEKWNHIFCSKYIIQLHTVSLKEGNYFFPLYINTQIGKKTNISQKFIDAVQSQLGVTSAYDDIFHYVYAVLNSLIYTKLYAQFFRSDFPKIPIPTGKNTFTTLVRLGKELLTCHTLIHPALSNPVKWITQYPVADGSGKANTIARGYPGYVAGKVFINPKQYFSGVPEEIWQYTIGGYQVASKWLKDRVGRKLALEEIQTYQQIILALSETIRIRKELDVVWD